MYILHFQNVEFNPRTLFKGLSDPEFLKKNTDFFQKHFWKIYKSILFFQLREKYSIFHNV